jgi:hypothetical protein
LEQGRVRQADGKRAMSRAVKIAGIIVIGGFIIMQFFRPERNRPEVETGDLGAVISVPDSISALLKNSCYDCHSNQTDYPWYSKVAPVSWYLHTHIRKGKDALNFSEFGNLDKSKQIKALTDICDMVDSETMPLKSYLMIHRKARIDRSGAKAICDWSDEEALKIMRE